MSEYSLSGGHRGECDGCHAETIVFLYDERGEWEYCAPCYRREQRAEQRRVIEAEHMNRQDAAGTGTTPLAEAMHGPTVPCRHCGFVGRGHVHSKVAAGGSGL